MVRLLPPRRTREPLSFCLQDSRRGQPRASGLDRRGRREEGSAAGGGLLPVHPQCGDSRDVPSVPAPVPRIASSPDVQELAVATSIHGDVEANMPLSASQPKAADLRDLDAGLDRPGLGQRGLFPSANVVEEMTETQRGFRGRTECQKAWRAVVPDLVAPFGMPEEEQDGSSVLKCEAWDFSLFCRSLSFC